MKSGNGSKSVRQGRRDRGSFRMPGVTMLFCCMLVMLTICPLLAFGRPAPVDVLPNPNPTAQSQSCDHQVANGVKQEAMQGGAQQLQEAKLSQAQKYWPNNRAQKDDSSNRRWLVGPGSSPPTCVRKCGLCQPCKAVHVAIGSPHGVISETEYYPEVWIVPVRQQGLPSVTTQQQPWRM